MDCGVKRVLMMGGLLLAAGLTSAFAARTGRGRVYAMPGTGVLAITNTQRNAVWRPATVTLRCPDVAERTVAILRGSEGLDYEVAAVTWEGQIYTYEFDANYWFVESNVLSVTVAPACTGMVEVIYE